MLDWLEQLRDSVQGRTIHGKPLPITINKGHARIPSYLWVSSENGIPENAFKLEQNGHCHYIGKSILNAPNGNCFVGPVIEGKGLKMVPKQNQEPLTSYEVLVDPNCTLTFRGMNETRLPSFPLQVRTGDRVMYIGNHPTYGIGMVLWHEQQWIYFSSESEDPITKGFEVLCVNL